MGMLIRIMVHIIIIITSPSQPAGQPASQPAGRPATRWSMCVGGNMQTMCLLLLCTGLTKQLPNSHTPLDSPCWHSSHVYVLASMSSTQKVLGGAGAGWTGRWLLFLTLAPSVARKTAANISTNLVENTVSTTMNSTNTVYSYILSKPSTSPLVIWSHRKFAL